jgi:dsRNA-specific ribonuclease
MKAQLREICDKNKWNYNIEYEQVSKSGPPHAPKYKSKAIITGNF